MRAFLISDNVDTLTGLRLVGIDGLIVHETYEFEQAIKKVLDDKNIGLLLIIEGLAEKFNDMIDEIKLTHKLPLVIEIPDRHSSGRSENFVSNYIREAIGIKL